MFTGKDCLIKHAQKNGIAGLLLLLMGTTIVWAQDSALLRGQLSSPRFAPGYRQFIAYERQVKDVQQLFVYNWQSEKVEQITVGEQETAKLSDTFDSFEISEPAQYSRFDGQLDWRPVLDSKGRQWFAFVSTGEDKEYDIYLGYVQKDGKVSKIPIRLKQEGIQQYPKWSPDGNHLAYVAQGKGEGDIYVALKIGDIVRGKSVKTYSPTQVTNNPRQDLFPCWSPDGRYLAYQAMQTESGVQNFGINLIDLNLLLQNKGLPSSIRLSKELRLYHEYKPSWSPDGKYIAYYVSQSELSGGSTNNNQDIGILSIIFDPRGNIVEGRIKSGSSTRLDTYVLVNRDTGPSWLQNTSTGSMDVYYVVKDDKLNPIKVIDLNCWLSNKFTCKRDISQDFNTQLHRDVAIIPTPDALTLAFISQEGNTNMLQVRSLPVPSNPSTRYDWDENLVIFQEKNSKTALSRSILFPGWGQQYKGQSLKSKLLMGGEIAALAGYFVFISQYNSNKNQYDDARTAYLAADDKSMAAESFAQWQSKYDGASSAVSNARIAAGLAAAIWIYNIWDARGGFPLRLPKAVQMVKSSIEINPPQPHLRMHNGKPSFGIGLALHF